MSKRKAAQTEKTKQREIRFKESGGEGHSKYRKKAKVNYFSKNSPFNPINYNEHQIINGRKV